VTVHQENDKLIFITETDDDILEQSMDALGLFYTMVLVVLLELNLGKLRNLSKKQVFHDFEEKQIIVHVYFEPKLCMLPITQTIFAILSKILPTVQE